MADWYFDKRDKKHYNLEMTKEILLRAEQIEGIEEVDAVSERLEDIYKGEFCTRYIWDISGHFVPGTFLPILSWDILYRVHFFPKIIEKKLVL